MIAGLLGTPPVSRVLPEREGATGDGDCPASPQEAPHEITPVPPPSAAQPTPGTQDGRATSE